MRKKAHSKRVIPVLQDGQIWLGSQLLPFIGFSIRKLLGQGAHGVVFEAYDDKLQRTVAVKIWTEKVIGDEASRAKSEISKLAQISHPFLVVVHSFSIVSGHPTAIMEMVDGQTAKSWLSINPSNADRCTLWMLYAKALRHIYEQGEVHGDPHTGNILVCEDPKLKAFHGKFAPTSPSLALKLVDTGSSLLWSSRDDFIERERRILIESSERILGRNTSEFLSMDSKDNLNVVLETHEALCNFFYALDKPTGDRPAAIVGDVVKAILSAPFFRLNAVYSELNSRRVWGVKHVFRLLGDDVGIEDDCLYDAPFDPSVIPKIEARYHMRQIEFRMRCGM
jgi:serine/threonine protein kinase